MTNTTLRLTTAQAIVRYLCNQFIEEEGVRTPLFGGAFVIFGHGNVTCLGEALEAVQDQIPTWRGQNEQSMAMAALAYTRVKKRRQIMIASASIGPGASNMLTAAAAAHTNRLPLLLMTGDTFNARRPDPVLQQVEHFNDPTITVNDSFKPLVRFWDRITHPAQILSSLPQAIALMLDPADCGPALLALPQDVQEIAFDYPVEFFEPKVHRIPRPRADRDQVEEAIRLLRSARRPMIVAGGGLRYSGAEEALGAFALKHGIPVAETIAGKASLTYDHPANLGSIGILGTTAANETAAEADLVLAVGTRLADFITGSWTVFNRDAKFVSLNTARHDAIKHRAHPVIGDARESLAELESGLGDWQADAAWFALSRERLATWDARLDAAQSPGDGPVPSYQQIVAHVNKAAENNDIVISAAGGVVGELVKGWRAKGAHTFDAEMGSSTMGYEIAAGWGAAMADPDRNTFVMLGDGSYMMMNADIYSSVLTGHKMIVIVCDNGGYAVINRLQTGKGSASFNNLLKDCRVKEVVQFDFAHHAEAMGALTRKVSGLSDLTEALEWAKAADRTVLLSVPVSAFEWTPGDAWWDVGVPEVSERAEVRAAYADQLAGRERQRWGV